MGVLSECPFCHRKQSVKNKECKCGRDLDRAKRAKKVRYWINYTLPGGKQKREFVGFSVTEARDAFGKRQVQKRENRIFDIKQDTKKTFNDLTDWYLKLEKVKNLASYGVIKISLKKFNKEFGNRVISTVKLADLENYQMRRLKAGKAPATVDHEVGKTRTMIIKAFDNDIVSGETLKTFKRCKNTLKHGADARDRILSPGEFQRLMGNASSHLKPIIAMGYYAGMRRGEILKLEWGMVDLKNRFIHLPAGITKTNEDRHVPILPQLYEVLKDVPRAIHDSHVFLYKGRPIGEIRQSLRGACKRAKIIYGRKEEGGFTFHDLRHTFNTNMRKAGVTESVIMEITGHTTRAMFDRYNTIDTDDIQGAGMQLTTFLEISDQTSDQAPLKSSAIS